MSSLAASPLALAASAFFQTVNVPISPNTSAIVVLPKGTASVNLSSGFFNVVGHDSGLVYVTLGACLVVGANFDTFEKGSMEQLIVAVVPGLDTSLDISGFGSASIPLNFLVVQTNYPDPWRETVRHFRENNMRPYFYGSNVGVAGNIVTNAAAGGFGFCYRVRTLMLSTASGIGADLIDTNLGGSNALLYVSPGPNTATHTYPDPYYLGGPRNVVANLAVNFAQAGYGTGTAMCDGYTFVQ
ncbi:MAG: hypothetical protein ACRDOE_00145 [Streptosporangiaceae bacterium]